MNTETEKEILEAIHGLARHIDQRFTEQDEKWDGRLSQQDQKWEGRFNGQDQKWESRWSENTRQHKEMMATLATKVQIEHLEQKLSEDIGAAYDDAAALKERVDELEKIHPH